MLQNTIVKLTWTNMAINSLLANPQEQKKKPLQYNRWNPPLKNHEYDRKVVLMLQLQADN